jgi:hypothetical protein
MDASNLGVIATVRGNDRDALKYYESGSADARGAGLVAKQSMLSSTSACCTAHVPLRRSGSCLFRGEEKSASSWVI